MMKTKTLLRKSLKWLLTAIAIPIVLFLVLALLVYLPPVQNFIVGEVTSRLSEKTGMRISVERVRLAFPLDLSVLNVQAVEAGGDTLLAARALRLEVRMLPLFKGRADVDGFSLRGVQLDTKDFIPDLRLKGRMGELTASAHGVEWEKELVQLDAASLDNSDICVEMSDTARKDTATTPSNWNIAVDKVDISRSTVRLSLPGDTLRLTAHIGEAALRSGRFDTGRGNYTVRRFTLSRGAVSFDTGQPSIPLDRYFGRQFPSPVALQTGKSRPALDPAHLYVTQLHLHIDTLSFDSTGCLRAGLSRIALQEQCGLNLKNLSGGIYMDSARIAVPALNLLTDHSRIDAGIEADLKALTEGRGGHCRLTADASIGYQDVLALAGGTVDPQYLKAYPRRTLTLRARAGGNIDRLILDDLDCNLPGALRLKGNALLNHIQKNSRNGNVQFNLRTYNLDFVKALLPASARNSFGIPRNMRASGKASFSADRYRADLRIGAGKGSMKMKADVNTRHESYDVTAAARRFPLNSFLPGMGLGDFSGGVKARGAGFDPLSPSARLAASARISSFSYDKWNLGGIRLDAHLRNGKGKAVFEAMNELLQGNGTLTVATGRQRTDLTLEADLPVIEVSRLAQMKDTLQVGTSVNIRAHTDRSFTAFGAEGTIGDIRFLTPRKSIPAKDLSFAFSTSPDSTKGHITSGDLALDAEIRSDISSLTARLDKVTEALQKQFADRYLDQEALRTMLPEISLYLNAGKDNPLSNILRYKGYTYNSAYLNLNTDPVHGLHGTGHIRAFSSGKLLLDTIDLNIRQDTSGVKMEALILNDSKRNPNKFEARMHSYLLSTGAGADLVFLDSEKKKGIDLGVRADLADQGLNLCIYPEHPVIAYRNFTVNKDNFIFLGREKQIRANVDLIADDGTGLKIYGEPVDSVNDLTLSLNNVNLAELSDVLPYLPRLGGMLSGDIHVTDNRHTLSAMASIDTRQLQFEGTELGNVGMEAIYLPKGGGEHHASAFISSNGTEVLECDGTYFDREGGFFEGEARLFDFPLQMLNGFLAGTDIGLKGTAGGEFQIKGSPDRPVLNGEMKLDTTHIYSDVYGFDFRTDEQPVVIENSRLLFKNYKLYSTGKEPLVMNGTMDMADFGNITLDFGMRARNFELINTKKKTHSMIFGKVYANYDGTLKGTTDNLSIRGDIDILDRTDMTYILKDSPLSVDDRLNDLVQFVSFEDTVQTEEKTPPPGGFNMTMNIEISDAARFHCNLSEDGQNYVDLEGGGNLTFRITQQGDMRLTGRFTANSGEMKYSLPVIPLKKFHLVQNSYVEFTGNAMNPTLNIAAKERVKAIVTENEQPRSVAFDVGVAITKPLEDMGLEFTIEAPEDLSVQNQLAAMSAEQRGKAAVTMLATGMYITDDSKMSGGGFKASNALNAFLQSEIQHIAGNALKTIDINLGVESGTSAVGTNTTDYSFQFAKRFWGNRVSVIIGGKVRTGEDAENSAESLIDNVSVEYRLDKSATRYVRVFYDRDTQDPLEGQLTRTGAGLVLRRKTDKLGELFLFRNKKNLPDSIH